MHGVRRGTRLPEAELELQRRRSAQIANVIRRALSLRQTSLRSSLDDEFLKQFALVESALLTNPDEYTLWSFRREVLIERLKMEGNKSPDELWWNELRLTTRALRNHPKAYPAWQHRVWLLSDKAIEVYIPSHVRSHAIVEEEQLTRMMLSKDPRNFHGWAHRMRVRAIQKQGKSGENDQGDEREFTFVEGKINDDFANYSAWHHRSVLLPLIHKTDDIQRLIPQELDYVKQAFYTEPDVQSVWFYHRWLLAGTPSKGTAASIDEDIFRAELQMCEDLLELEPEARHALQVKAHILMQLGRNIEARETLNLLRELVSCLLHRFGVIILMCVPSDHNLSSTPSGSITKRLLPLPRAKADLLTDFKTSFNIP